MTIFVDADSCPSLAKSYILKTAKRNSLKVTYVANRKIPFDFDDELFTMQIVESTPDAADNFIFENAANFDIVITRDLIFAKKLVENNIFVMNDRGKIFTKDNINDLIAEREWGLQLKSLGVVPKGKWKTYCEKDAQNFAQVLENSIKQKK